MAFCQPFLPADENNIASNRNIIYLDNSYSMSNEVDRDLTALDAATEYVQSLINVYPEAAEYKLITNDFSSFSNTFKGKAEIADFLTQIDYSGSSRSAFEIKERIESELSNEVKEVFWIGDFQKTILAREPLIFDSLRNFNLIPLSFRSIQNVSVDSVFLNTPVLIGDIRPRLTAIISNTGLTEVNDLVVKVILNEVEVATGTITILPNDKAEISFDLSLDLKDTNKGKITLQEFPVTFDNDFYFTLTTNTKISVLEVKENAGTTPVETVYGNQTIFEFKSFQADNLDYSLIEAADLIIINELASIEPSLLTPLNSFIDQGGSLLVVPPYRPDVLSYRVLRGLSSINLADTSARVSLATPDFDNPFFANVFEDKVPSMAMPEVTTALTWGRERSAILRTQAGYPYLSENKSQGSTYLLAAPLSESFGTFQDHALFVPVMYRLAMYGANSQSGLYEFIDSETITFPLAEAQTDMVVKLKGEEEFIPAYQFNSKELALQLPKYLLNAGFYDLEINNEVQGAIAFNYAAEESDLNQEDDLLSYFQGNVKLLESEDITSFKSLIENKYVGVALWRYAICLSLFFLLCEVLLIRFLTKVLICQF